MAGKRVGIGLAGGTAATDWPRFFDAIGIEVNSSNAGANDSVGQLSDGLIDAFAFAAGLPTGAFSQLAFENDAVFLSLSEELLAAFLAAEPGMSAFTIRANTYEDQPEPLQSVSLWNFAIAHKDMDEETACQITKLAMENNAQMLTFHAAAKEMLPENVGANTFITFHPGAVRWFEVNGQTIPDALKWVDERAGRRRRGTRRACPFRPGRPVRWSRHRIPKPHRWSNAKPRRSMTRSRPATGASSRACAIG